MSKRIPLLAGVLLAVFLLPLGSFAQSVITGRVFSALDHSPAPSVTVSIKGTRTGTATGIDGGFAIKAKEGDILVFSGVGVVNQEVTVGAEHNLTLTLTINARSLSEVVVTATGIRKEAKRLGYALQTVDASTLTQAREADPINALKGQAAGLEVNINQEIGHPADVIMRGENRPV